MDLTKFVQVVLPTNASTPIIVTGAEDEETMALSSVRSMEVTFGKNGAFQLPLPFLSNYTIQSIQIVVNTAFSDGNATISVGTDADHEAYVAAADIHPQGVAEFDFYSDFSFASDTVLKVFTSSAGSQGSGVCTINYTIK